MTATPLIVSPDDHVQAPAHVWQERLPAGLRDRGPRIERLRGFADLGHGDIRFVPDDTGHVADVWHYDGKQVPLVRIAAAAGVPRSQVDARPITYDDMRKGFYDPTARLADMDTAGIEASVCYPNMFVRFCGQTFSLAQDKDLALACIRAYNDFIVEEWCAGSHGRLVPMGIVPLWDVDLAVAEVERLAALDFRSITFSEAPHLLGLPSIHSGTWNPLFAACADHEIVVSLHIGTGGFPALAKDSPGAVPNVIASFNAGYALVDWLFSGHLARYPQLKICLAESQLGWIPYVLSRADFVWREMRGEGFSDVDKGVMPEPPSFYFGRNVWCTFFRDPVGLAMLDQIGVDRVLYETDYPHTDTSWPDCLQVGEEMTNHLSAEDAERVLAGNARDLFRIAVSRISVSQISASHQGADVELTDPTSRSSEPTRYWSSANIGEATPEVLSPMCWSFWGPRVEAGARRSYYDFGILDRHQLTAPDDPNQLLTSHFYGRPAMNLDRLRSLFDSIPGMTADDFERDICGEVRPNLPPEGKSNRLPFIVTKAPVAMATSGAKLRRFHGEQRAWWEREVRDRDTPGDPLARLVEAADRFERAFHLHVRERLVLMTVQAQLTKLAYSVERPDLVLQLLAGLGGVAETEVAEDLWEVSRGQLTVAEFVRRHGYHGPNEGNLTSHSWREDAAPVERLVAALAARPDSQRPRAREAAAGAARQQAIAELVALVPSRKRPEARWYCKVAVRAVQANELGKASYLMGIDGGRAATRDVGAGFVAAGKLDDADDAFYFTVEELQGGLPDNAREVVAHRRRLRDEHRAKELPITFTGMPEPVVASTAAIDVDDEVRGLSGAAGVVQGRARVVLDPATAEPLDDGEVLVCRFTDPSWTPLFLLASALVIDIGASASHGAIVARELGIPCVIGTGDGTRRIATGDLLTVDGSTGVVTISERAVAASGAER